MQTIISKILPLLWLKISPSSILKSSFDASCKGNDAHLHNRPNKRSLVNAIIDFAPNYSEDEAGNIQKMLFKRLGDRNEIGGNEDSVFNLLIQVTDEMLIEKNGEPLCKYAKLLRWNMMSHKLGQDIFTTSYFAYRDCVMSNKRHYMAWSPIVRSDNIRIQTLLGKGLAENHFHLKGSAQIFDINWVSLMNDILHRHDTFSEMQASGRLFPIVLYGTNVPDTFYNEFKQAALIRTFLFAQLNGVSFKDSFTGSLEQCLTMSEELEIHTYEVHRFIDLLKYEYGRRMDKEKDGFGKVADYAIPKNLVKRNNNANLLLVGERKFLYDMFKEIYRGRKKQILDYQDLFYAYLVIKARLRAELIQVNDLVGFKNFANYQDRKTLFIKQKNIFEKAIYKMAVDSTRHNQNISSLEARITPEINPMVLKKQ